MSRFFKKDKSIKPIRLLFDINKFLILLKVLLNKISGIFFIFK